MKDSISARELELREKTREIGQLEAEISSLTARLQRAQVVRPRVPPQAPAPRADSATAPSASAVRAQLTAGLTRLELLNAERLDAETRARALEKEVTDMDIEISRAVAETSQAKRDARRAERDLARLRDSGAEKESDAEALRLRVRAKETALKALEGKVAAARAAHAAAEQLAEQRRRTLEELGRAAAEEEAQHEERMRKAQAELDALRANAAKIREEGEAACERRRVQLREAAELERREVAQLERAARGDHEQAARRAQRLRQELDAERQTEKRLKEKLRETTEEIALLEASAIEAANAVQCQLEELAAGTAAAATQHKEELAALDASTEELTATLRCLSEAADGDVLQFDRAAAALRDALGELLLTTAQNGELLGALESSVADTRAALGGFQEEADAALRSYGEMAEALEAENRALVSKGRALETEVAQLRQRQPRLRERVAELRRQNAALRSKLASSRRGLEAEEREHLRPLQQRVAVLTTELQAQGIETSRSRKEAELLRGNLRGLTERRDALKDTAHTDSDALADLRQRHAAAQQELEAQRAHGGALDDDAPDREYSARLAELRALERDEQVLLGELAQLQRAEGQSKEAYERQAYFLMHSLKRYRKQLLDTQELLAALRQRRAAPV